MCVGAVEVVTVSPACGEPWTLLAAVGLLAMVVASWFAGMQRMKIVGCYS